MLIIYMLISISLPRAFFLTLHDALLRVSPGSRVDGAQNPDEEDPALKCGM